MIALSALMHAMALAPFKASRSDSPRRFSPLLTVDLPALDSPRVSPEIALAPAVDAPPAEQPVTRPAAAPQTAETPAAPNRSADATVQRDVPPPQPPDNPLSGTPKPSPNPAPQVKGGVRIALPDEVAVTVRLLSYEAGNKPNEFITVEGQKYIYFKSPSLAQQAKPLEDARPHYPADKPEYIHGAVVLHLLIDEEGKVERTVVVCSNPRFEASAIASIQNMRFIPARDGKGGVKSYMSVEFGYGRGFPCAPVPDLSPSK